MEPQALHDLTMDHMMNPRNYGKLERPDAMGIGKNPENGEMVILYLAFEDHRIEKVAFQAKACMTTIIAGSVFTDTIKGTSLEEARELTDIMLNKLEGLPPEEAACSEMVAEAFLAALEHYESKKQDAQSPIPTHMITRACMVDEKKEK